MVRAIEIFFQLMDNLIYYSLYGIYWKYWRFSVMSGPRARHFIMRFPKRADPGEARDFRCISEVIIVPGELRHVYRDSVVSHKIGFRRLLCEEKDVEESQGDEIRS